MRGSGPALLLLQGGAGGADVASAFTDVLARSFTVVSYDRRGQSRSPVTDPYQLVDIETHSDDAHRLLEHITSAPAYVFGGSIGAVIGLDLALAHPVRWLR